ncbi:SpoIIE family protein phosphatase [Kitasatospora sp. NPDC094015]|uniref:SpoIIE family protein phosphatase n=1 Tax=Kitasatospora sp. NPDC094015 TaxID=3155205 RepID=UPI003324E74D
MDVTPSRPATRTELRCVRLLLRCTGAAELLATVLAEGPTWITGEGSALYLLDSDGMLRLAASHGLPDWAHERYGLVDPAGDLPAARALRRRATVLLDPERPHPGPAGTEPAGSGAGSGAGRVALAVLPLVMDDAPLGVLALALAHRGTVPQREIEALETIAEACAHRLSHLIDHVQAAGPAPEGIRTEPYRGEVPLLSLAVRAAGAGAFERDLVTGETAWDRRAYQVLGLAPPTDRGTLPAPDLSLVVHPEDLPDLQAGIADALAAGGPYRLGYRVVRADGSTVRVEESGEVMLDGHGRPARIAGLLTDRDRPEPTGPTPSGAAPPEAGLSAADRSEAGRSGAEARTTLLLQLTRALSRAITVRDVTTALTEVAGPALGATGVVLDVVDEGRLLPVSPTVFGGPYRGELNRLTDLSAGVTEQAPARATPLFSEPQQPRPGGRGPDPSAWAVLPLVASGRQVGSCLITFDTDRAFGREDRTMYSAFAGILAQSLERARLYDIHHHRATELQRAMLPRTLPRVAGLRSAARYLPGTEGMQIGGDWYDLLRLPHGRLGLVIGDVQGHNAEASAVMGQLRSGLRAYATDGHGPAATLARTSRLLAELDTELFATCLYLTLDPATGALHGARAGHPQPVRITGGRAAELELPGGPPLGVDPHWAYESAGHDLAAGETLLIYTDGLVEDRDEDYDDSLRRMLGSLELWARRAGDAGSGEASPDLERLAELLTLTVTERNSRPDDVALLLLHRGPGGAQE